AEAERTSRHEAVLRSRLAESELAALRSSAELAESFRLKDLEERRGADWSLRREADRARRGQLMESLAAARTESRALADPVHACELVARDLGAARDRISDRLREEYQIDLAAEYATSPLANGGSLDTAWDDAKAAKEVEDLRRKIRHLGSISLEALAEL